MLVICPNPASDRHLFIDELRPGTVLRSSRTMAFLGARRSTWCVQELGTKLEVNKDMS